MAEVNEVSNSLDKTDLKIIQYLTEDGRVSFTQIAKDTKLTDVAIKKRVERLKRKGVIQSITANLNLKVLGYENPIYVLMRTELSKNKDVIKKLQAFDNIIELYQVLGEYNIMAKLVVTNLEATEKFIDQLGLIDGVIDAKTQVILSELKKSNSLPSTALQKKL
ncbi:MAG: Lrp/AsnC family transcriptional regulator [Candidatus Diapherotrites archaeon]|nr:Lrp/AsnC family transcriptional regulator [Candidatus Diapherotrites archaeon]